MQDATFSVAPPSATQILCAKVADALLNTVTGEPVHVVRDRILASLSAEDRTALSDYISEMRKHYPHP